VDVFFWDTVYMTYETRRQLLVEFFA